jgi:Lrp/AsnC family transcriptional regulator, leucine-responsive regulatory protein
MANLGGFVYPQPDRQVIILRVKAKLVRELDRIDRRILRTLQQEGRISNTELAERVGLSATPCSERVKRLERDGFITGYHARLNPHALGQSLLMFVEIRLSAKSGRIFDEFKREVLKLPNVLECHLVSGDFDYLIKARIPEMNAYRKLLGDMLLALPGARESRSFVVMEEIKESLALTIDD